MSLLALHACAIRKAGKPKLVEKWGKKMQKAGALLGRLASGISAKDSI